MPDGKKVFTIIGVAAGITIIILLYSVFSIQSAFAKFEARDLVLSGLGTRTTTNASGNQSAPEPAKISVTLITQSKEKKLVSLAPLLQQLRQLSGVKIISEKTLEKDSGEAKRLIEKYTIERIPTVVLEGETKKATALLQNWPRIGSVESDGTMVLTAIPPIYLETGTGRLRGGTKAVFVSVPDRNGVFNAEEVFTQILQNAFGIKPIGQETVSYDSPEGKAILSKYGLEKLPTFIISGDLNAYTGFPDAWLEGGTVEADGTYVFRSHEAIRGIKYIDMDKNEVVETPQPGQ